MLELGRNAQLQFFEINVRIRRRKMETGRDLSVLENEHRFEKASDARRSFQMAKIGFDGTNRQRRGSISTQRFRERMRLHRIAYRRSGSVRLNESNFFWRHSRAFASLLIQSCLRCGTGHGDTV